MSEKLQRRKDLLEKKSNSFAFLIGIGDYQHIPKLHSPVNDVNALSWVLKEQQGFDFVGKMINATSTEIRQLMTWLKGETNLPTIAWEGETGEVPQKITKRDYVVFYFGGHGTNQEINEDKPPVGFLMPADAASNFEQYIKMEDVYLAFSETGCRHFLMILDCCFAGTIRFVATKRSPPTPFRPFIEKRFKKFLNKKARQVLVSAGPTQKAADLPFDLGDRNLNDVKQNLAEIFGIENDHLGELSYSPFAIAMIKALTLGRSELQPPENKTDGIITPHELIIYLKQQVSKLTKNKMDQSPEYFPIGSHEGGDFIFLDPTNPDNFADWNPINPYKGLFAFEPEDARFFCGRQAAIEKVLGKLEALAQTESSRFLFVTAPSGHGKTSLVKAGVYPVLRQKMKREEEKELLLFYLRPVQIRLKKEEGFPEEMIVDWMQYLDTVPEDQKKRYVTITNNIEQKLKSLTADQHVLLLIDQLEELFTNFEGKHIQIFVHQLIRLQSFPRLTIICTVRSDFEWQIKKSNLSGHCWKEENIFRLPQMKLDQLREAIGKPASMNWFEFDDRLDDIILSEVEGSPGAMPLLSFVMNAFYHEEKTDEDRLLKLTTYRDKLNGVHGALSKKADELYQKLKKENDALAHTLEKIFIRMVNIEDGGYARRRVYYHDEFSPEDQEAKHELDYPDDDDDQLVKTVINKLVDHSLIIRDRNALGKPFIEPVHDTLIQHWDTGKAWIEKFCKDNILLQRALWKAVSQFKSKKNNKVLWADNPLLDQLKVELDKDNHWLNQAECNFVRKSWQLKKETIEKLKQERDSAQALATAIEARRMEEIDPTIGFNLAYQAYQHFPNAEAASALNDIASNPKNHFYRQLKHKATIVQTAIVPEAALFVTVSKNGKVHLWDFVKDKSILTFKGTFKDCTALAVSSAWTKGKKQVLIGDKNGTIHLLEATSDTPLFSKPTSHKGAITKIQFSNDDNSFVTGAEDGSLIFWDKKGQEIQVVQTVKPSDLDPASVKKTNPSDIVDITLHGRANVLTRAGLFYTCMIGSPEPQEMGNARSELSAKLMFSSFRKYVIISAGVNTGLQFWKMAGFSIELELVKTIRMEIVAPDFHSTVVDPFLERHPNFKPDQMSVALTMSDTGDRIFVAFDKHVFVFNEDGLLISRFSSDERILGLKFYSPDQYLITILSKGIRVYQMQKKPFTSFVIDTNKKSAFDARFSPQWGKESNLIIFAKSTGEIRLWNHDQKKIISIRENEPDNNEERCLVVFSPDGKSIIRLIGQQGEIMDLSGDSIETFKGSATFSEDNHITTITRLDGETIWTKPDDFPQKYTIKFPEDRHLPEIYLTDQKGNQIFEINYSGMFKRTSNKMVVLSPEGSHILLIGRNNSRGVPGGGDVEDLMGHLYNNPISLLEKGAIHKVSLKKFKDETFINSLTM